MNDTEILKLIDEDTYKFITNNVLVINKGIDSKVLEYYINKAIMEIIIKTNRTYFPNDLRYFVIELINDAFAFNTVNSNSSDAQSIKSMTEGDRRVEFGMDNYSQNRFNLLLQQKLADNEKLINRYRLLYKVVKSDAEN